MNGEWHFTIEDVLGVFVLDESRAPEDQDAYGMIFLFRDDEGKPSYLSFYREENNHEVYENFEDGHFAIQPTQGQMTFEIEEQYYSRTGGGMGYDITYLRHHQFASPKSSTSWSVIKDKFLYFRGFKNYYVPAREVGRTRGRDEQIIERLRNIRQNHQQNWEDKVNRYVLTKLRENRESDQNIAGRCGITVAHVERLKAQLRDTSVH